MGPAAGVGAETEVGPGAEVEGHVAQVAKETEAVTVADALGAVVETKGSVQGVGLVPLVSVVELICPTTDAESSTSQTFADVLPFASGATSSAFDAPMMDALLQAGPGVCTGSEVVDPVEDFKASVAAVVAAPATHTGVDVLAGLMAEVDVNRLEPTGPVVQVGPVVQETKPPPASPEPVLEK